MKPEEFRRLARIVNGTNRTKPYREQQQAWSLTICQACVILAICLLAAFALIRGCAMAVAHSEPAEAESAFLGSSEGLQALFEPSLAWLDAHEPLTLEQYGKRYLLERAMADGREVFEVLCTAYAPGTSDCPGTTTATGTHSRVGYDIAVRAPYLSQWAGTVVFVEGWGIGVITDCGSFYGRHERKLDVTVSTAREADAWGVEPRRVVVLVNGPNLTDPEEYLR